MEKNKVKEITERQWKIYNLLKSEAVGKEKAISGNYAIETLKKLYPDIFSGYHKSTLQSDVRHLKMSPEITRRIGSNVRGYWLEKKGDGGIEFQKKLATSHIQTAVASGVPVEFFYRVLNSLDYSKVADGQVQMNFDGNSDETIKLFSDDLGAR